jgi:hypothetical protein
MLGPVRIHWWLFKENGETQLKDFAKADTSASYPHGLMNFIPTLGICISIANSCTRWSGIFEGLSQDGGRPDFSKNLRSSLFHKGLSMEPNFGQIYLANQYLSG